MKRIPLNDGDEQDVFGKGWRQALRWSRGEVARVKNKYRRRFRQAGKSINRKEADSE